jgi:hypothetical protein
MAGVRCMDVPARPTEFLDWTSGTLDELQLLVPPCEAAGQAPMPEWRRDGTPRTARRLSVDPKCPLPTPEERLCCILTYLQTYALQGGQGRLGGRRQRTAQPWRHVLWPAGLAARRPLGDAPARARTALAQRLGVSEVDAATGVTPLEEAGAPEAGAPVAAAAAPLVPLPALRAAAAAPKTLLHRQHGIAASQRTTPATRACASMPCSSFSCSVTPMAAAPRRRPWVTRRRSPCRRGAGCDRSAVSGRARFLRWGSSCRRSNPAPRSARWRHHGRTRRSTSGGGAWSTSIVVSSAAASCRLGSAGGSRVSALW